MLTDLRKLTRPQRAVCIAGLLGWTLDAFDFFLMVFMVKAIAHDFHAQAKDVLLGVTLTLMFRPLGAFVFGWLAERYGRRPVLMANITLYSLFELSSAFAPTLGALLILRSLFGFAMGGEWGVGSSLVMETIPAGCRGLVSGILQEGYAIGYLLASLVFLFFPLIGWRGMFMVGVLPALLVVYIRAGVNESPAWRARTPSLTGGLRPDFVRRHGKRFLYVVLLMTAFNFLSHGTQDVYPTFLGSQHNFPPYLVSPILIVANLGAILGGILFGLYSQRAGRRRAIILAALLILPVIPLWAFSSTAFFLGLGAFLLQVMVQGAWGVVPVHLNELSPEKLRSTFPGFAYQVGNLFACGNAVWQAQLAEKYHGNYGLALAVVAGCAAIALAIITACGPEAKGTAFGQPAD